MPVRRPALLAALVAAGISLAGCPDSNHGSTKPPRPPSKDQQYRDKCRLSGGIPVISHQRGETQYNCVHTN